MIQRIETLTRVTKAGIINLLLWSGLFAVYLVYDKYTGSLDWDLVMVFIYLYASILLLNTLFFLILKFLLVQFRYGPEAAYVISNLLVTALFFINNLAVSVYGKQLGMEGVVMAWRGWTGGEMGDFTSSLIKMLIIIILYAGLFTLSYTGLDRLFSRERTRGRVFGILVTAATAVMLVLHIKLAAMAAVDWKMNIIKHKIPWQSVTGFPEDQIRVNEDGRAGIAFPALFTNPPLLDENTELTQLKKLHSTREKILSSHITVSRPMNILFINCEGLRADMLNPQNMPHLYRFASQRGFILKKHYTTGNNTPGSLYGMLTGLAPFYFEPLRGNQFKNMTLEVMKKAGYRQSIYYNSPKQYEYIYRDIIAGTEGFFVRAPGTKFDDYGPRERILVDRYISELKNYKSGPRFDYYLMNVTHFNYYYPEEFRRYKPDYTKNFTIISGPQEKFRKDRVELKNRYMNSVLYCDHLLNDILKALENTGRLRNTIVVITGDHGEEFWEHGSFGHTWGLNNIQVQPAAMIFYPGIKSSSIKYRYTSHQDFFPTVFDLIGISADWRKFTTGKSLIDYDPDLDFAISSLGILCSFKRNGYAIMGDGYKILFRNNMDLNTSPYAIYDDNDMQVDNIDTYRAVRLLMKAADSKRLSPFR
ncbi:MAG TPA: sulfatase-like hydrolase/transferase [Spirochaetota bacterium]|nr:sulfatase-like hydrolase/transferase [Spirochaetota bacterium]